MPKKNKSKRKGKKNLNKQSLTKNHDMNNFNFVQTAGKGCHIIRYNQPSNVLGWDTDVHEDDFGGQSIPDIAIDPDENTLTLCNVSNKIKVAYITVYEAVCIGQEKEFEAGSTTDNDGNSNSCVTFIVLSTALTFCTLCHIDVDDITLVRIESDVQEWKQHPDPSMEYKTALRGFPLEGGPFLCTQGVGGHLTHYFSGNLHAIDFRCQEGTPLLAVEDGVVVQVTDGNTLTGIGVSNMFKWNSILLRHESDAESSPIYIEYVHIKSSSVAVGDIVKKGDRIGFSGGVGFSPEPHLHFSVFKSDEADALSVGFYFEGKDGSPYQPQAGKYYNVLGKVEKPITFQASD